MILGLNLGDLLRGELMHILLCKGTLMGDYLSMGHHLGCRLWIILGNATWHLVGGHHRSLLHLGSLRNYAAVRTSLAHRLGRGALSRNRSCMRYARSAVRDLWSTMAALALPSALSTGHCYARMAVLQCRYRSLGTARTLTRV